MKYPKLVAALGLPTINIQSGLFGANAHARLDEEQLQKLEDQLSAVAGDEVLQGKFDELQQSFNALQTDKDGLQNAVSAALELNGLTKDLQADATGIQGVELLGKRCKEYGASKNRHSFAQSDGEEPEEEPDPSKDYQHNKIMTQKFAFPKIKE